MAKGKKQKQHILQPKPAPAYFCLNMIVRDEKKNIRGCLDNVSHLIDAIAIVDTGSKDNTISLINSWAEEKKIPCSVASDPWIDDFGYSRTFALRHGEVFLERLKESTPKYGEKQWYFLFMDADNRAYDFEGKERIKVDKEKLLADSYKVQMRSQGSIYDYTWLVRVNREKKWKWHCPRHEALYPEPRDSWQPHMAHLEGGYIQSNRVGARSQDPKRYIRDAFVFEKALVAEPLHDRNLYYLGQSYKDAAHGIRDELIKKKDDTAFRELNEPLYMEYLKRAEQAYTYRASAHPFDTWKDEYTYLAWHEAGRARLERKGYYDIKTHMLFSKAFELRPYRLEAAYYILTYYTKAKLYHQGWLFAKDLVSLPFPSGEAIFVDRNIHHYFFYYEASLCAYHSGNKAKFVELSKKVLNSSYTNDHIRELTKKNLETLK